MLKKKGEIVCILGIFLFALFLRMYAFTYLPRRAITDDSYEYNYIAHNLGKAIKGEQLEDRNKFLYLGAKRGWLYSLFLAGIYKFFGLRVLNVRLAQVIIDSLTCLVIYFIARDIFNKKVGVVAILLSSFYPGFIYYSTMLYQETTTTFLLALFIFFLNKAISQKKSFFYFISGIFTILITFYRSGFLLFPLVVIPALFFTLLLFYKNNSCRYFFCFLAGTLSMFIIYCAFSYKVSGRVTFNKPSSAWLFYETIHRDGWVSDTFSPTPTEELNEIAKEYSPSTSVGNQVAKLPPAIYIKAGIRYIQNNPLKYFSQLIKGVNRMWSYIETYPGKWHSKRVWVQLVFHRCLLILGLIGVFLSLTMWYYSWPFYLTFLYTTCVYIPIIAIPRYAVPSMPFIIILAAYAILFISDILKNEGRRLISWKFFLLWVITVIVQSIIYYLGVPHLLALFPHTSPKFLYYITILSMNLLFIIIACGTYYLLDMRVQRPSRSFYIVAFPLVIVMLLYNNETLSSKTWHEWETPLYAHHQKIKQTIQLTDGLNIDNYREAHVMIDMFGGGGQDYNFQVKVNGKEIKVYQSGIKAKENKFDNKFFGLYKSFFFDTYKLSPEDLRQWYEIELPLHFLENNSLLVIECSLSETVDHERNYVIVFGDYATSKEENLFEGPCFPRNDSDTSLTKIMPYSGDYRFEKITKLNSRETISEYYSGLKWQHKDLSGSSGMQSGSYRIRLEVIDKDGNQLIY